MELLLENTHLTEVARFRHAICYRSDDFPEALIVQATSAYIPKTQFQELFIAVGQLAVVNEIKKAIFDMRRLTIFEQATMDWYYMVWKEAMFHQGLKVHRNVLPANEAFRENARIGREKIKKSFPQGAFKKMDIKYCDNLEEALEG